MILEGSSDEGTVADWMEANIEFRMTTIMVNQHRVEEGRFPVGRNAVMNAFDRMNPILSKIQKRCQGDTNNEAWATAKHRQCKQLLIMRGDISKEELLTEYPDGIPHEFHPDHLPTLTRNQVVFFDETHIEQEGGLVTKTGIQIRFPRDASGKYAPLSPDNPTPIYADKMEVPSFKYAAQSRLCLGVAAVKLPDGTIEGRKTKVFDYTSKRMISLK